MVAGYVPLALSPDDHVELLPATCRAVNAYGIKISRRIYDGAELNPLRMQHSGVTARKGLHEIHYDPYDISRIWVRDHWNGGWITVFWTQLHRVAPPFGELAWDHARGRQPGATEEELADAVADLLDRASRGPGNTRETGQAELTSRDRRVAARTKAAQPVAIPEAAAPGSEGLSLCGASRPVPGDLARSRRLPAGLLPRACVSDVADPLLPWQVAIGQWRSAAVQGRDRFVSSVSGSRVRADSAAGRVARGQDGYRCLPRETRCRSTLGFLRPTGGP